MAACASTTSPSSSTTAAQALGALILVAWAVLVGVNVNFDLSTSQTSGTELALSILNTTPTLGVGALLALAGAAARLGGHWAQLRLTEPNGDVNATSG